MKIIKVHTTDDMHRELYINTKYIALVVDHPGRVNDNGDWVWPSCQIVLISGEQGICIETAEEVMAMIAQPTDAPEA
jgi:hypothetical protein